MTAVAPCLALDADLGVAVPLQYVRGVQAVVTRCLVRLRTVSGSWLSDRTLGAVDAVDAIDRNARYDGESYRLAVREQLSQVVGVVAVSPVSRTQTGRAASLTVTVTVDVDGEAGTVTLGSSPYDSASPLVWYVVTSSFGGPIFRGF